MVGWPRRSAAQDGALALDGFGRDVGVAKRKEDFQRRRFLLWLRHRDGSSERIQRICRPFPGRPSGPSRSFGGIPSAFLNVFTAGLPTRALLVVPQGRTSRPRNPPGMHQMNLSVWLGEEPRKGTSRRPEPRRRPREPEVSTGPKEAASGPWGGYGRRGPRRPLRRVMLVALLATIVGKSPQSGR